MGLYQIYLMDKIPESAAVNESVDLAKKYCKKVRSAPGLVNGVLRNAVRTKGTLAEPKSWEDKYSHPGDLINELKTYVGKEIRALYKSDTTNCYDRIIGAGKSEEMGNALCYMLTETVEKYGWDLWKKTFDYLYKIPRNQEQEDKWSDWKRFNYLLDALNRFTPDGSDVRSAFSGGSAALATVKGYLSKVHHGNAEDGLDNDLSSYDKYVSPRQ